MTAQEAIKNLEVFTTDEAQRLTSSEFDDSITMAIEALEKQIPKKPKTEPFYGGRCIVCNALIPNKSINYCHECGQKLDLGE